MPIHRRNSNPHNRKSSNKSKSSENSHHWQATWPAAWPPTAREWGPGVTKGQTVPKERVPAAQPPLPERQKRRETTTLARTDDPDSRRVGNGPRRMAAETWASADVRPTGNNEGNANPLGADCASPGSATRSNILPRDGTHDRAGRGIVVQIKKGGIRTRQKVTTPIPT